MTPSPAPWYTHVCVHVHVQAATARDKARLEWHAYDEDPANMVQVIDKNGRKHKMPLSLHAHLQNVILDRHAFWFLLECCRVACCMHVCT